ncbi:MAG TPA: pyridoxal-phosphate dependent enzyme [Cyclobacteriaceae bacterium]|nr:pyridoxal-phosphate dependent enzyme [Cyclobacteriaceae bacterium]
MLPYTPTPVQELFDPLFAEKQVKVLLKREDLNHIEISGNKWWKLKYNLQEALSLQQDTLLTFGGAYSNHIYATAAAAKALGLKSIGIIRGEENLPLNATLSFAKSCGMHLHYVSREVYRNKSDPSFIEDLQKQFGRFYIIPEGGSNALAVKGIAEFAQHLERSIDFDYCCVPVGTGGTMAGLINGFKGSKKVLGFAVLKGGEFLVDEIKKYLNSTACESWQLIAEYHFGGYAKSNQQLLKFMHDFKTENQVELDFIYTAKMMFGVFDLIRQDKFKRGSKILCIHTGGLQGNIH